jgi:hypothetical protein
LHLVSRYFRARAAEELSAQIHARFSGWYARQPIDESAVALQEVRSRVLAIRHSLLANDLYRATQLMFGPFTAAYTFSDWLTAWGHHTFAIELLTQLLAPAVGATRGRLFPSAKRRHG